MISNAATVTSTSKPSPAANAPAAKSRRRRVLAAGFIATSKPSPAANAPAAKSRRRRVLPTGFIARGLLRLVAPLVWRSQRRIAAKLEGFAATEAGSALDMLKAAELTDDPALRRLFFRHAMDEARHAQLFRRAARTVADGRTAPTEYTLIHATRQNLLERYGLLRFVAFVHLAERRGELQFLALRDHFRAQEPGGDLERLFDRIARDERFHVQYSGRLLEDWRRAGRAKEVRWALARVRLTRMLDAWRRTGRLLGDALARLSLSLIYLILLPIFALLERGLGARRRGWQRREGTPPRALASGARKGDGKRDDPSSLDAARRQY